MKVSRIRILCMLFLLLFVLLIIATFGGNIRLYMVDGISRVNKDNKVEESLDKDENIDISKIAYGVSNRIEVSDISGVATNIERVEVYDGLTIEELTSKLNRYLKDKGVLANKGSVIATKSLELGVDPYVAVAIMMHETGCNWKCSRLVINKNNVGGMRGRSGKWQSFKTLDAGITGFLNNLSKNYYKKGLNTPEKMANKYAGGSNSWAGKVQNYVKKIEAV